MAGVVARYDRRPGLVNEPDRQDLLDPRGVGSGAGVVDGDGEVSAAGVDLAVVLGKGYHWRSPELRNIALAIDVVGAAPPVNGGVVVRLVLAEGDVSPEGDGPGLAEVEGPEVPPEGVGIVRRWRRRDVDCIFGEEVEEGDVRRGVAPVAVEIDRPGDDRPRLSDRQVRGLGDADVGLGLLHQDLALDGSSAGPAGGGVVHLNDGLASDELAGVGGDVDVEGDGDALSWGPALGLVEPPLQVAAREVRRGRRTSSHLG